MVTLKKEHLGNIIQHCRSEAPAEACGLMAGVNEVVEKIYPMTNDERSGARYLINPKEQFNVFKKIREEKLDLLGIYHSHVASEAYPSVTDIELAVYDVSYLIVSLAGTEATIKAFKIKNGQVSEEKYVIQGTERS